MLSATNTRRIAHVIDPSDGLFPAVVVGYRMPARGFSLPNTDAAECTWTYLEHQAGGYACSQHAVVGLVLRFAANVEHARQPTADFFRAFALLQDDPNAGPLEREFPRLTPLQSVGAPYYSEELDLLRDFTEQYFALPPPSAEFEAEEALVELQGDPLEWFSDWRIWTCAEEITGCVDHTNIAELTRDEDSTLTPASLRRLEHGLHPLLSRSSCGASSDSRPRIYLL